ncbi:multidrug efflux system membrane fusion protein/multidrug efflux system membrane fusion protein [Roseimicrobium gellanilyticum]|uniref:Multidrug efflux system membrane fusion protein/multidrug efflux system membrane fusion protein n=2 Tax=Roseimicrobium gellanilyticum TaxID=748857 RepID=A0A366HJK3_9BACT|nr:multidrug efflux system membrane fusion protein/multidrug efflux system membrane fusion protein [Roseimicrobium gellanilyticum]
MCVRFGPPNPFLMTRFPKLLALAGVAGLLASCEKPAPPASAQTIPNVTVAVPVQKRLKEWDEYVGRLASPQTVQLRARVSGYLDKVHAKDGAQVKAGDVLYTIDPRSYRATVERAEAELERARTRQELAASEARRAEGLVAAKAISAEDFEQRVNTRRGADAEVRAAAAAVELAKIDLAHTEVRAPIAGRISDARVREGNLVIGDDSNNSTLLTTIVAVDPIYCYIEVDERSSLKYRELYKQGKRASALFGEVEAEMALANEEGFPHRGVVDFVDNEISPDTGTIRSRCVFPNKDSLMSPGYFARVRVPGSGEYDALLVRDSSIGSDQGRPFVFVVDAENVAHYRTIETGALEDGLRIVRNGLKPGEKIVINGLMAVRNSGKVNPQESPMPWPLEGTAAK